MPQMLLIKPVLFDPKYLKVDKFSFANSESQNSDELDIKSACL